MSSLNPLFYYYPSVFNINVMFNTQNKITAINLYYFLWYLLAAVYQRCVFDNITRIRTVDVITKSNTAYYSTLIESNQTNKILWQYFDEVVPKLVNKHQIVSFMVTK